MAELTTRRLGRTEMRPLALGLGGAWWAQGPERETIAGIHRAIELGLNYIDTYPGEAEERWGRALQGGRRAQVYLQGKVSRQTRRPSDHSAAATRRSVEASLQALRTDYLDAVLIHGYDQLEDLEKYPAMRDPLGPGNALDELVKMKQEGLLRHIGIGARAAAVHRRAIETGQIEIVLSYLDYNLLDQSIADTTMPLARQWDVGLILASPLGMGLLTGLEPSAEAEGNRYPGAAPRAHAMWQWCRQRQVNIRHLAMQFCLAAPIDGIVLPGPSTRQQVEEAVEAATTEIPPQVWADFKAAFGIGI